MISNQETGYTFPVGHVQEMAEAALSLLQDQEKYQSFSEASIRKAVHNFSAEGHCSRVS